MPKKIKNKKQSHSQFQTHPFAQKKEKKNYQRKVQQLNITQMRKLKKVHIFKNPI